MTTTASLPPATRTREYLGENAFLEISRDFWEGQPVTQFDFYIDPDRSPHIDEPCGDVRVLVSARRGYAPHVKWVFSHRRRKGFAEFAYRYLAERYFSRALRVDGVFSDDSLHFHRAMRSKGLVDRIT